MSQAVPDGGSDGQQNVEHQKEDGHQPHEGRQGTTKLTDTHNHDFGTSHTFDTLISYHR